MKYIEETTKMEGQKHIAFNEEWIAWCQCHLEQKYSIGGSLWLLVIKICLLVDPCSSQIIMEGTQEIFIQMWYGYIPTLSY